MVYVVLVSGEGLRRVGPGTRASDYCTRILWWLSTRRFESAVMGMPHGVHIPLPLGGALHQLGSGHVCRPYQAHAVCVSE